MAAVTIYLAGLACGREDGAGRDEVSGTGHVPSQDADIGVRATSRRDGSGPEGDYSVTVRSPQPFELRGSVTCLAVTGETALVGGRVEESGLASAPRGSGVFIELHDGAGTGAGADRVQLLPVATPPSSCANPPPHGAGTPITSGDYTVHDR